MPDTKTNDDSVVKLLDSIKDEECFTVDYLNGSFTEVVQKADGTTETRHRQVRKGTVSVSLKAFIMAIAIGTLVLLHPELVGSVKTVVTKVWFRSG